MAKKTRVVKPVMNQALVAAPPNGGTEAAAAANVPWAAVDPVAVAPPAAVAVSAGRAPRLPSSPR